MALIHRLDELSLGARAPIDRRAQQILAELLPWQAADVDRHSVHWCEWKDGKACRGSFELDEATATSRDAIIELIVKGEWQQLDRIRCGNEALGTYRDVTRDIADDVLQHCIDKEVALSAELRNWLHNHVGIRAVEDAVTEHPYLDNDYHCGWNR